MVCDVLFITQTFEETLDMNRQGKAKVATIQDVATSAGVSISTVSRVTNGVTTVNSQLATRVKKAISDLQYEPNISGKSLRDSSLPFIVFIVPNAHTPFFTEMLRHIEDVAWDSGKQVVLCNSNHSLTTETKYIKSAAKNRMSGAIISPLSPKSRLDILANNGIPTITVDREIPNSKYIHIGCDNFLSGQIAAHHLLQQGIRSVTCITSDTDISVIESRMRGFVTTIAEHQDIKCRVLRCTEDPERIADLENSIVSSELTDAFFCTNGPRTVIFFRIAKRLGIKIPEDTLLLGFDNDNWTELVSPPISVIRQPVAALGKQAAEIILQLSKGTLQTSKPFRIEFPPDLIIRESSVTKK